MPLSLRVDTNHSMRRVAVEPPRAIIAEEMGRGTIDLDVGVIYSGERHYMTPLVASLAASAEGLALRLLLVDNDSADGVATWTRLVPQAKVIANSRALGYAANLNRILSVSDARYTLLLNTDMYFDAHDECLTRMVAFMDRHPRCGLSICRIYHPDGTYGYPARRFPTWQAIAARRLGCGGLFAPAARDHLYEEQPLDGSFACDWASGCFLLVRREAVRDVGLFDEQYVKYFEDVDYCLRMWKAGWQVLFNGDTRCFHYEQRASRRLFSKDAWRHGRAYARWLSKWGLSPTGATPEVDREPGRATARADQPHALPVPPHSSPSVAPTRLRGDEPRGGRATRG